MKMKNNLFIIITIFFFSLNLFATNHVPMKIEKIFCGKLNKTVGNVCIIGAKSKKRLLGIKTDYKEFTKRYELDGSVQHLIGSKMMIRNNLLSKVKSYDMIAALKSWDKNYFYKTVHYIDGLNIQDAPPKTIYYNKEYKAAFYSTRYSSRYNVLDNNYEELGKICFEGDLQEATRLLENAYNDFSEFVEDEYTIEDYSIDSDSFTFYILDEFTWSDNDETEVDKGDYIESTTVKRCTKKWELN